MSTAKSTTKKPTSKKPKVSVAVRIRPMMSGEPGAPSPGLGNSTTTAEVVHIQKRVGPRGVPMIKSTPYTFTFPHVFPPSVTNKQVFDEIIAPLLSQMDNGKDGAMFAYGFTGSGKTHSVYGPKSELGLVFLAAQELMSRANAIGGNAYVRVGMFEVVGKGCFDLMNDRAEVVPRVGHGGEVTVRGLVRRVVQSVDELAKVIGVGVESRQVGSSTVHDESSRSHAVVDFDVVSDEILAAEEAREAAYQRMDKAGYDRDTEMIAAATAEYEAAKTPEEKAAVGAAMGKNPVIAKLAADYNEASYALDAAQEALKATRAASPPIMQGQCAFIDMAGNDWEASTDTQTKEARREHAAINTSLLAVKECIRALATGAARIPYRNTSLTHVLQRHFGKEALIVMLATVSPSDDDLVSKQTLNTLRYAHLVGGSKTTGTRGAVKAQGRFVAEKPHKSTLAKAREAREAKAREAREARENARAGEINSNKTS